MLKILFLTSELTPFSRTGRQGDLVAALAPALKRTGHEVRVVTPRYEGIRDRKYGLRDVARLRDFNFLLNNTPLSASIKSGFIPCSKVQIYFIENPLPVQPDNDFPAKVWSNPFLTSLLLIFGGLQLTSHLNWTPDIIYCCGEQMSPAPIVIRTNPLYRSSLNHSRIVLHLFRESSTSDEGETFYEDIRPIFDSMDDEIFSKTSARRYADSVIEPQGTVSELLEFLSINDDESCIATNDSTHIMEKNPKCALQARLGFNVEPDLPIVALWSGGIGIETTLGLLEAELPKLEAQFIAIGGDELVREKTEYLANRYQGKIKAATVESGDILRNIGKTADILFVPHSDSHGDTFKFCRRFPAAVPLLTEDIFAGDDSTRNYQIPNYAHSFVFPSGETRAMIDALRKTTETYKNPLNWNELVQRGVTRELCCEHIARNMAEEFSRLLLHPPACT